MSDAAHNIDVSDYAGKTLLVMAGGTGGHVFPALATAQYWMDAGGDVQWLGTKRGIEFTVVPKAGITLCCIKVEGVRGKGKLALLLAPFKLLQAVYQAWKVVSSSQANVVLGMGGFASGPGGLVAWLQRKPLIIHEQNAVSGTTNRILSKIATKVLAAFPNAFKGGVSPEIVGNPIRKEITLLPNPEARWENKQHSRPRILVFGGSLGAAAINEWVPQFLAKIPSEQRPEVRHQAGKKNIDLAQSHYDNAGVKADVVPFIEDMAEAYAWADFVICRAGALTVSELTAVGLGALLIPLPHAIDDHQTANARVMEVAGAGILVKQDALNNVELEQTLTALFSDKNKMLAMAIASRNIAKLDATEVVASLCQSMSK